MFSGRGSGGRILAAKFSVGGLNLLPGAGDEYLRGQDGLPSSTAPDRRSRPPIPCADQSDPPGSPLRAGLFFGGSFEPFSRSRRRMQERPKRASKFYVPDRRSRPPIPCADQSG